MFIQHYKQTYNLIKMIFHLKIVSNTIIINKM